jgi:hypothetical protein
MRANSKLNKAIAGRFRPYPLNGASLFATTGRAMQHQCAQSFFFEVLPIPGLKLLVGSSAR